MHDARYPIGPFTSVGRPLTPDERDAATDDVLLEIYGWHCPNHEAHIQRLQERRGW